MIPWPCVEEMVFLPPFRPPCLVTTAAGVVVSRAGMNPRPVRHATRRFDLVVTHASTSFSLTTWLRWRHAVWRGPPVDRLGDEVVAEGVHGQQRGHLGHVAEVVSERPLGEGRAGGGLRGDDAELFPVDLVPHEGQAHAAEVAPAAGTADDHVGVLADLLELLFRPRPMIVCAAAWFSCPGIAQSRWSRVLDGPLMAILRLPDNPGPGEDVATRPAVSLGLGCSWPPGRHHHAPVGVSG
jgi:hypothetical protein